MLKYVVLSVILMDFELSLNTIIVNAKIIVHVFIFINVSTFIESHRFEHYASGRAKNWQKVAYLRRDPSPSVKWKTIAWMIWQDVEVSWIARITFSKRGSSVKIWQKLHF